MTARQIQIGITIVATVFAVIHATCPTIVIDGVTLTLILVAILPWLAPLFKSVELPGGVKVEFQELEKAKERADRAGLLAETPVIQPTTEYSFQTIAEDDPNLALAGLRIEIEKRLIQIAKSRGIEGDRKSVGRLLQILTEKQLLTGEERSVLSDMLGLLNSAVHGALVDERAAAWAVQVGPRLLKSLDERIQR
jgi:hypothetical protein